MKIIAYDPYVSTERAARIGVEMRDLGDVLRVADFITVHLPRTRETEGMIDAAAIALMKPGVRIINVARGGIVVEADLAAACESGRVAGAAVDVFDAEPTTESPLFALENVVVTPHLGASTREAQDKAGVAVARAVADALNGELPITAVNLDLGVPVSDAARPFLALAEQLGTVFVTFARGLPATLNVVVAGLVSDSARLLAMAALRGVLGAVTEEAVTYVNVSRVAESFGISVHETATEAVEDYRSLLHVSGEVEGEARSVSGTILAGKGLVLTQVDGYPIELALTEHMLFVRNDDRPGMIGKVGTLLGEHDVNISNMAVGRHPEGGKAIMGISLDSPVRGEIVDRLVDVAGITTATFVGLGPSEDAREVEH
jgi:D-3-phosphoglycerate dehydrogenase